LGYVAPSNPEATQALSEAGTHRSTPPPTHRDTLSPEPAPTSEGSRSGSEATPSPRQPLPERLTQLSAPPYSGAGSAGTLPDSVVSSADVVPQLQGLGVSNDARGNTPPPQYAPRPPGGANTILAGTTPVSVDETPTEDVDMS
jgi:hypothetical protein